MGVPSGLALDRHSATLTLPFTQLCFTRFTVSLTLTLYPLHLTLTLTLTVTLTLSLPLTIIFTPTLTITLTLTNSLSLTLIHSILCLPFTLTLTHKGKVSLWSGTSQEIAHMVHVVGSQMEFDRSLT